MSENIDESSDLKEVPAEEIIAKIKMGEPVEYDHVFIRGRFETSNLNLPKENDKFIISSSVKITNSCVNCRIFLNNILFSGAVDFSGSQFSGDVVFILSQFKGDALFIDSRFCRGVHFTEAQFFGTAYFLNAQFIEGAYFSGSHFSGNALFLESQFSGTANFSESLFRGRAVFGGAQFRGDATFYKSLFKGTACFGGAQFGGKVDFLDARFGGDADFSESQFNGTAYFWAVQFDGDADFSASQFMGDALFESANFIKTGSFTLIRSRFQKIYINYSQIKNALLWNDEACLSLVENYKRLGWFEDADECYYDYRMNYRIEDPIRRILDLVARFLYGYGVKPARPLILSAFVMLLSGIIFKVYLSTSFAEAFFLSVTAFTSGVNPVINSTLASIPYNGYTLWVFTLERLLGPLFFALFLASIGKTIIR
jgi:uncharacterized protein YjbI with pentapeptide repeats